MAAAFKYEKVAHHLRQLLASGTLGPARRLPSFSTLRRQLKVTQATIDSALAMLEGEGLIDRRPGAGIFASAPTTGNSGIARNGILILSGFPLDLPSTYHQGGWGSAVFFGAMAYCHRKAYRIILMDPHRLGAQEVRSMEGARLGAILLMPSEDRPLSTHVHQLCAAPVPKVAWDCSYLPSPDFMVMQHDHAAGAQLLTEWLLARGKRRILQVATGTQPWMMARREGHLRAMKAAGIAALPMVELKTNVSAHNETSFLDKSRSACGQLAEYLVGSQDPVDAIMAPSDGEVSHLARACRLCGREPNRDVELVGYDNYWLDSSERAFEPTIRPLATVEKNNQDIGGILISCLEKADPSNEFAPPELTPPTLVVTDKIMMDVPTE